METNKGFIIDEIYGERLLISIRADQTELKDNVRVARVLLNCFNDMFIIINEHLLTIGHKNPRDQGDRSLIFRVTDIESRG